MVFSSVSTIPSSPSTPSKPSGPSDLDLLASSPLIALSLCLFPSGHSTLKPRERLRLSLGFQTQVLRIIILHIHNHAYDPPVHTGSPILSTQIC